MARPSKILTKEDIVRAQTVTRSNMLLLDIYMYLIITIRNMLGCIKMMKVKLC